MIFLFLLLLNYFLISNAYFGEKLDGFSPLTIYNTLVNNDNVFDWDENKGVDATSTTKQLINLFNITEYRSNVNSSSLCNITGLERLQKCHQVYAFDWKSYNETILHLRKMFILRLGIAKLPGKTFMNVTTLRQTMKLFDAIEKQFNENTKSTVKHTYLDKDSKMNSRAVKSMYKSQGLLKCDQISTQILKKRVSNALCLSFNTKYSDLYKAKLNNNKQYESTFLSVYLWLNINIIEGSSKNYRSTNQTIIISDPKLQMNVETSVKSGWNTIDIAKLVKPSNKIKYLNDSVFETLIIKCQKDCVIDITENNTQNKTSKLPIVQLSASENGEPLLQINNIDENSQKNNNNKVTKRSKRDTEKYNGELQNLCKNNKADLKSKCCLVSYRLDFSVLKLTNWVQRPLSYPANFCFGHCTQARGNKNNSNHYDIKNLLNGYNNKNIDTVLPACCHPTKMASLSITYRNQGTQLITKVLPNMIVTECGCS